MNSLRTTLRSLTTRISRASVMSHHMSMRNHVHMNVSARCMSTDSLYKSLLCISPIDGRYSKTTKPLESIFSEYALIKNRVIVEIRWLQYMANSGLFPELPRLSKEAMVILDNMITNFTPAEANRVKEIESVTRHDVKAVEYYLKEKVKGNLELESKAEFLHFACTSEDISNLSYALMVKEARETVLLPMMDKIIETILTMAEANAHISMLSRTHGQAATPTTVGKELANFAVRLAKQRSAIAKVDISGKFNGAVGNYNAHISAYPDLKWQEISESFVTKSLDLSWTKYSTQTDTHDFISEIFDDISRFNTILLDLDRDMWGYVMHGYWKLVTIKGEIGSSTMPHKVNPIDFENSEGNLGIANSTLHHLSVKLPISRFQRDLSDSTVLRTIGVGIAHSIIAYNSTLVGLSKVTVNTAALNNDLNNNLEVLAEPIQTIMRRYGMEGAYEKLKELTRGKKIDYESQNIFIKSLDLPQDEIQRMLELTPQNYIGEAETLAKEARQYIKDMKWM